MLTPDGGNAAGDMAELERKVAYFQALADRNGARLLIAETNASKSQQELDQRTRGFTLLARLSSDVAATETPASMAASLASHLGSMLNMSRTVVLIRQSGTATRFAVQTCTGYNPDEQRNLRSEPVDLPEAVALKRQSVATFEKPDSAVTDAFIRFALPFFLAVPVVTDGEVGAVIVTGRMREQRPFSAPLSTADLETMRAIAGFFGAYLLRYQTLEQEREREQGRLTEVERLVAERTLELEQQKTKLEDSLRRLGAAQEQLVMREKMASLGELTAGIAHEIKNPLNFVNNFSDLCRELSQEIQVLVADESKAGLSLEQREEVVDLFQMLDSNLTKIHEHGNRADSIVRNMLQHSRADRGAAQPCELNVLISESIDFAYHAMRAQDPNFNVTLTRHLDPAMSEVMAVPQEISRVIINLLSNSLYATKQRRLAAPPDYHPAVLVSSRRLPGSAEIRVRDNGTGIAEPVRSKIFTPFFTTKPTGEGTGLGLSISYDIIVKGHAGRFEVKSEPGEFTEFVIELPLSPS